MYNTSPKNNKCDEEFFVGPALEMLEEQQQQQQQRLRGLTTSKKIPRGS